MTREYDIKNAAWDYFQDLDSHHFHLLPHCNPQTDAFEAGAKWADKTIIEKACKWIENYVENAFTEVNGMMIELHGIELSEDFRKAMEEEL